MTGGIEAEGRDGALLSRSRGQVAIINEAGSCLTEAESGAASASLIA